MFKIKTWLQLFEKSVGSSNTKCNLVDTQSAEEDEIAWWLLILASLLPRAGCQEEMLKVRVGLPHRGHEAWILLAGHREVQIFLVRHQNVELFSFDLWSWVSCCPLLGQMPQSQKLRPVALPFDKLGNNCSALNLAI